MTRTLTRRHPYAKYINTAATAAKYAYKYGGAVRKALNFGSRGGGTAGYRVPPSGVYGLVPHAKKRRLVAPVKVSKKRSTTARYAGKFGKGRKARADPALSRGFVNTTEINGVVTDPDVVYVGASSISSIQTIELVMQSLLRKLFQKAGMPITNIHQILTNPIYGQLRFTRTFGNTVGSTTYSYNLGVADTIYVLVGDVLNSVTATFSDWKVNMVEISQGSTTAGDVNLIIPTSLSLWTLDTLPQLMASLDLTNEYVHFKSKAEIKIQNRTLSASGSGDAENVTANPLVGYRYDLKGGLPRWRDSSLEGLTNIWNQVFDSQGMLLIRGGQFSTTASAVNREPPHPKMFANCVKSTKIILHPGTIKSAMVKYSKNALLIDFLQGLGSQVGSSVFRPNVKLSGKMSLFAFEDMINVNATENISIAYECNRVFSVYCTTGKVKPALGQFYVNTLNNTA